MTTPPPTTQDHDERDAGELAVQLDILTEENQRLRTEYTRAKQSRYRRTAIGLGIVGLLSLLAALIFPPVRTILIALGAIGVFAAILTYYLTPERFIPASVGQTVYDTYQTNVTAITNELGLNSTYHYIPIDDTTVRLYVPEDPGANYADSDVLTDTFVTTNDHRGLALTPTGLALFAEFEPTLTAPLSPTPSTLADQLTDGITDGFELATHATHEFNPQTDQITVGITDSAFGPAYQFDHPISSFLAVGFALGLNEPITLTAMVSEDPRYDTKIILSWPPTSTDDPATESEHAVKQ